MTFHNGLEHGGAVAQRGPFLARFFSKLVLEVLPAALASIIGGFLFAQYQFSHPAPRPNTETAPPVSAEMVALVRDEHAKLVDFLKAQAAAEQNRIARANEESTNAVAEAESPPVLRRTVASAEPARSASPRPKMTRAAASQAASPQPATVESPAPLLIARADQQAPPAPQVRRPDADSLFAETLAVKDHVLSATFHVVSAIGGIPSWIGRRLGGRQNDFAAESS